MAQTMLLRKQKSAINAFQKREFIQGLEVFKGMTDKDFDFLENRSEVKLAEKFDHIYLQSELSNFVYFLIDGTIKTGTHSDDGKEIIKAIIHPDAMFGELGILGQSKRQDFACAMNNTVKYLSIRVSDFQELMRVNFQLTSNIMSKIGKRLMQAETKLESLIFKDARTRIIDFLKDNAAKRGRKVGFETFFKHSLTQQDIANITGTSRQTVTSVLNELRKSNLIYFNRRSILIRDIASL